jgi:hypothetical protein
MSGTQIFSRPATTPMASRTCGGCEFLKHVALRQNAKPAHQTARVANTAQRPRCHRIVRAGPSGQSDPKADQHGVDPNQSEKRLLLDRLQTGLPEDSQSAGVHKVCWHTDDGLNWASDATDRSNYAQARPSTSGPAARSAESARKHPCRRG